MGRPCFLALTLSFGDLCKTLARRAPGRLSAEGTGAHKGRPYGRGWIPAKAGMTDTGGSCAKVSVERGRRGGRFANRPYKTAGMCVARGELRRDFHWDRVKTLAPCSNSLDT